MQNPLYGKSIFHVLAVGLLAASAFGIAAAGIGGSSSVAYAYEEEPCLGVVGETVESEVVLLNTLLSDPATVVADEINFVLGIVHDPFGAVNDEIDTVHSDLDSVQACLD